MHAAVPMAFSNLPPAQPNPFRSAGAGESHLTTAVELAKGIALARQQSTAPPATRDALVTQHTNPMVEHWQLAARAATAVTRTSRTAHSFPPR